MASIGSAVKHWAERLGMTSPEEQEALDRLVAGTAKPVAAVAQAAMAEKATISANSYSTSTGKHFATAMGICNCGDRMCIYSQGSISTGVTGIATSWPTPTDPFASERETWIRTAEGLKKQRDELAKALEVASLPKPIEQRAGHVPTRWLAEAFEMAKECDAFITIQLEEEGVAVIGRSGEEYGTIALAWEVLETSPHNPLLKAIEGVERHLSALERLKELVADRDKKEQTIAA
jgi:hypothetical protein